ncbi:MAG: UDP-N-acetylmuramate dehydrogenase [Candidatus Omnitrophota bacterium]
MLKEKQRNRLCDLCQKTGSSIVFGETLAEHSTISIGGEAVAWLIPSDLEALKEVRRFLEDSGILSVVTGNASNVLFPDKGLEAVVINLSSAFFSKKEFKERKVTAGAGLDLRSLLSDCCRRGLSGLEGLAGIPATVGGAVFMNASYLTAISDRLEKVLVLDENSGIRWVEKKDLRFAYRSSSLGRKNIVVEAVFSLDEMPPDDLKKKLRMNFLEKMERQPLDERTLGCIFKNPPGGRHKSGELIDIAGMKGVQRGGARVSDKHANFIVNTGKATSEDVVSLIGEIREKVREKFKIELETEIEIL